MAVLPLRMASGRRSVRFAWPSTDWLSVKQSVGHSKSHLQGNARAPKAEHAAAVGRGRPSPQAVTLESLCTESSKSSACLGGLLMLLHAVACQTLIQSHQCKLYAGGGVAHDSGLIKAMPTISTGATEALRMTSCSTFAEGVRRNDITFTEGVRSEGINFVGGTTRTGIRQRREDQARATCI